MPQREQNSRWSRNKNVSDPHSPNTVCANQKLSCFYRKMHGHIWVRGSMDKGLTLIFVLTFVIHLIGTLAYSVRIAGTRTRRVAISLSLFNIWSLYQERRIHS